nr:MAG TPA: portal protein [Caudoviricetes sp.]
MASLISRAKHAWNAFMGRDPTPYDYGPASYYSPNYARYYQGSETTTIMAVYNRIALDASSVVIQHVRLDENDRYSETINDGLNYCLTQEANIDQTSRAFIQDCVLSMFTNGSIAIVPVDATNDITFTDSYDVLSMRVGKIIEWRPQYVKIDLYNENDGQHHEIMLPKRCVAIVPNPLYAIINEPNSTMQRLMRKISMLDAIDAQNSAGKLDLIIQLPYVIKSDARKKQAEERRREIEVQLSGSKYGIAYTDGTEKITQLNRPLENNLQAQIEYLTSQFYAQLGITTEVLNGSADESTMLNYNSRTIEPIVAAIVDAMRVKFLSKTARSQRQDIIYFRDPFKLVPISNLADIADKFTRNEILTSNEVRQIAGMKPSSDPNADELRNKNLNKSAEEVAQTPSNDTTNNKKEEIQNGNSQQ